MGKDFQESERYKGHDRRETDEADPGVRAAAFVRLDLSADVQYGGFDHRRQKTRRGCACGGRFNGFDQLYDPGLLHRRLQRFCDSRCADIRCQGFLKFEKIYRKRRIRGGCVCGGNDGDRRDLHKADPDRDGYAGDDPGSGIFLYLCHLYGNSRGVSL